MLCVLSLCLSTDASLLLQPAVHAQIPKAEATLEKLKPTPRCIRESTCMNPRARMPWPLQVSIGVDPYEIFSGADWALMVGAQPRGPGMERSDLIQVRAPVS